MKYRDISADLIRQGKNVALYCDGLYSDTNILYLDKFYGVWPAVVIDNDPRKKGATLFDIPIMPYAEAKERFPELYYYIQGNTYQYALIGELLEDGVPPERIVNYVPVEKREGCLIAESSIGISKLDCGICYETGFSYNKNNNRLSFNNLTAKAFHERFLAFRDHDGFIQTDGSDCREKCPLHKKAFYAVEPKIRLIGDYNSDFCEMACVYCFLQELGMEGKANSNTRFHEWLPILLHSDYISDALVLHFSITEKCKDEDVELALAVCDENISAFESINLFSCCYAYRENLEPLLSKGVAKVFWSLDAGTDETYRRMKRKANIFSQVLENAEKYKNADAFGGMSIIPKYCIVKGINDNEADFDGFIKICKRINARFCAIQWDYADNDNTDEADFELIRTLYRKIHDAGLKLTYQSGSTVLSKAMGDLVFYENYKARG